MNHCKVIMLGDTGVGKTKMVQNFIGEECLETDFSTKIVNLNCGGKLKLNIMDTAGMERYKSLPPSYYRDVKGAILVYDVTKRESFANVKLWLDELRKNDENVPVLLIGNNCDKTRQVSLKEACELVNSQEVEVFSETNSKNTNVDECVRKLAEFMNKTSCPVTNSSVPISLNDPVVTGSANRGCC